MKYGHRLPGRTLFPLGITAIERHPEGYVEVTIGHEYTTHTVVATAGRLLLTDEEAVTLAADLLATAEADTDAKV
jgi:hypothetical protein